MAQPVWAGAQGNAIDQYQADNRGKDEATEYRRNQWKADEGRDQRDTNYTTEQSPERKLPP